MRISLFGVLLNATVGKGDILRLLTIRSDVQPRAACPFDGPFRPAIWRRNASAFSKRPSFIFLFMEIIQLVAINVHDKAQHIVDQSRKPCAFIPQQVEDFRHFALGLRTDINRRAVTAIYRSEEGAFEIRQYDLFSVGIQQAPLQ